MLTLTQKQTVTLIPILTPIAIATATATAILLLILIQMALQQINTNNPTRIKTQTSKQIHKEDIIQLSWMEIANPHKIIKMINNKVNRYHQ